jgi:phage repressor protein C with HTH and peptisase S24 domain
MVRVSGSRSPERYRRTVSPEVPACWPKAAFEVFVVIIQSSNVMPSTQHRIGVDSQADHTDVVFEADTSLVRGGLMKGKFPNGLAEAIKLRKISQGQLAEAIGTSQQQIGRLVNGEREMTAIWAERLAAPLKTSPEQLVFPNIKRFRAPVLSWVSAGRMAQQEGVRKTDIKKYVLLADLPKGDWIVLEVEGDSMDRIAPDGSYIAVNLADQRTINDKFYVFGTEQGEATFKRFRSGTPPRLQPFSTNPDHETQQMSDQMLVVGRVGRVINDLR